MDHRVEAIEPRRVAFGIEVAEKLRRERKRQGLTLKQVGDKAGTTPQTIQRIETANMTLSAEWVEKICKALDMDPRSLMAKRKPLNRRLVISTITAIEIQLDELKQLHDNLRALLDEDRT